MTHYRSTHSFVTLEVSETAFKEIATKLLDAGYSEQFHTDEKGQVVVDMRGIAITQEDHSHE